jgi:DNA repair exonuclease SbcCD nuclease subunit
MYKKIAIFSDLHLGVHQNSDFWLSIANTWADWYIAELHKQNITEIIFGGDFFHYRDEISVKTLNFAKDFLDKFTDFNITMITGNHDAWYKDTSEINSLSIFKGYKNLQIYDKIATLVNGHRTFTFCPWGTAVADIPKSDVVIGHFELENFKMNAFKICEHGDDPEVLIEKAPLIFSGHFHTRDVKVFDNKSKIVYVGNPYEMDFGDSGQRKGFYVLDTNNLSYTFHENHITPKHIKVLLSKLIVEKDVVKFFNDIISNNIIKLTIDKNINTEHLDLLVSKLLSYSPCDLRIDYDVNYNKVKFHEDDEYDLSGIDVIEAVSEFINMLDIDNKSEVVKYTTELYKRSIG